MKIPSIAVFALPLALAFHVLGDDAPTGPKDLGTVTIGDKTYEHLHVTSITDLGIKATWDGGLGTILFSDMTPDLQKKFGYDPNKFKTAANARAEHDAQSDAVATAQAKVDQANLQKSDGDAAKQKAAVMAPKNDAVKGAKYLVGNVLSSVPGGYFIRLDPIPSVAVGDNGVGGGYVVPSGPFWPRVGFDLTVILKSDAVHTVGEGLAIPVVEAGIYTDSSGNNFKQYTEVVKH